ncbi:PREDICTED: uncharacterized protein LOC106899509 [Calidris pugnax]|uniref:uncharacterized protein LOC106899509 n=1 Tax=Calidris pugnax TaxID=198806 RepID=UPI00071E0D34|nr:PREDICTED: uncharacterized protein LOC106899509 [Calidris pugnax]
MVTLLSHGYGAPLAPEDLCAPKPPLPSLSSDDNTLPGEVSRVKQAVDVQQKKERADKMSLERNPVGNQGKMKKPKFEAFRISPVDGKSVFNYSCQSLNSAELAKKCLRWEMAKEPKKRFTYCHEYLSATFDPVDVDAASEEFLAKSKSMWLSPDGFVFPGFKSSFESNLHPRMPDEARVEELREKWQENALHANLRPVLPRDRWGWDKRHIDFDLYKKPPEHFMTTAPRTVRCWPCEDAAQILQTASDDTELEAHQGSRAAQSGPRARLQPQKLRGLLKDEPGKLSLGRAGPVWKPIPALPALGSQPSGTSDLLGSRNSITGGFAPGPGDQHSLKHHRNGEHGTFGELQGTELR